jgi:glycosyltransferase involved in cell wall biosynthesis
MSIPPGAVWLDARATQSIQHAERGISRFVAEHIRALIEIAPEQIGFVGIDPALPVPDSLRSLSGSGKLQPYDGEPKTALPSIFHVMSPFEAGLEFDQVWPGWVRASVCRLVVTLHDLIPLVLRAEYFGEGSLWGHWGVVWTARLGLIRSAQQVLANSRHTADDAIEQLGIPEERITVIESGVSDEISSLVGSDQEAESLVKSVSRAIRPGFLLYVGGDEPRKNLEGTIRAFALLPEEIRAAHQLVITCRMSRLRRAQLAALARRLGIGQRELVLTGFVQDRELAALYRSCELFVFPSLYEGAGLPILEAMSCGAPVAASNTSSIPELLGDDEATFDPTDPGDIARCLERVVVDQEALASLRERSRRRVRLFTWERVAKRTLAGYERALEAGAAGSRAGFESVA